MEPTQQNAPDEDLHLAAAEADARLTEERNANALNAVRALWRLRTECKNEIRAAVGLDKQGQYEEFHARTKQRLADLANQTRHTMAGLREAEGIRAATLKEAKEFITQLEIDGARIKQIQRRYAAEASKADLLAMPGEGEAPYVEVTSADVPTMVHNPWTWVGPPFEDSFRYLAQGGSRGSRYYNVTADPFRGEWDIHSTMTVNGADDSDLLYLIASTSFKFWFQMPAAGLVEMWVFMQSVGSQHSGTMEDEWGNSDGDVNLLIRSEMQITNPWAIHDSRLTLVDYHRGEREGRWSTVIAPLGEFRYAHFFSPDLYDAGQWVRCTFGTFFYHRIWVNDMSVHHDVASHWFIPHVAVRSTGAP